MKTALMELGRSMVETLGVLAIIGVLSIVGITGYKQAMLKIKANEAINAALKFRTAFVEKDLVNPCPSNWYKTSNDQAACSLDLPDLLPSFANRSYSNFLVYEIKPLLW